jgi:hypothetical protein
MDAAAAPSFEQRCNQFLDEFMAIAEGKPKLAGKKKQLAFENVDEGALSRVDQQQQIDMQNFWLLYLMRRYGKDERTWCIVDLSSKNVADSLRSQHKQLLADDLKLYQTWAATNGEAAKILQGFALPDWENLQSYIDHPKQLVYLRQFLYTPKPKVSTVPPIYSSTTILLLKECLQRCDRFLPVAFTMQFFDSTSPSEDELTVLAGTEEIWEAAGLTKAKRNLPDPVDAYGHVCALLVDKSTMTIQFFDPFWKSGKKEKSVSAQTARARILSKQQVDHIAKALGCTVNEWQYGNQACEHKYSRDCNVWTVLYFHLTLAGFSSKEIDKFWGCGAAKHLKDPKDKINSYQNNMLRIFRQSKHGRFLRRNVKKGATTKKSTRKHRQVIELDSFIDDDSVVAMRAFRVWFNAM